MPLRRRPYIASAHIKPIICARCGEKCRPNLAFAPACRVKRRDVHIRVWRLRKKRENGRWRKGARNL